LVHSKLRNRLVFWCCGCAVLLLLSIGCFIAAGIVKNNAYRDFTSISSATQKEDRIKTYRRAIALCPDRNDAYLLLLDVYGEDGIFDKTESGEWLGVYNANHSLLRKDEATAGIYAQAGLLYVNGYEETATVSLRMALPFFEAALPLISTEHPDYCATACYARIGQYYRDYIWTAATREVTSDEMAGLLSDIKGTLTELYEMTEADRTYNYLGFANAVCNLLYDQRDILAATVDMNTVTGILDLIYRQMPETVNLQSARSKEMAQTLLANQSMYYDMISRAYDRNGGIGT
jgi:hypothetical protein